MTPECGRHCEKRNDEAISSKQAPPDRRACVIASGSSLRPLSIGSGLPGKSLRGQTVEILAPAFLMFYAELVEVIPRIDPGIMKIVEGDTDSVIADRFNTDDADMGPTVHERLLSRTMALHFGGWALDTQIIRGQGKMAAVVECNI